MDEDKNSTDAPENTDKGEKSPDSPAAAKWTDKDLSKYKGDARKEGRQSGEKSVLEALGFDSVDEAKQSFERFRNWEEDEKSELDKAADCIDKTEARAKKAEAQAEELSARLRERDRRDAILSALSESGYQGKTAHALGAIDASFSGKVKEKDGSFDATEAVAALKEDEFPGFAPDLAPPVESRRTRQHAGTSGAKTPGEEFEERQKRRGARRGQRAV